MSPKLNQSRINKLVLTLDSGKILGAARVFLGDTFSVSMDVEVGPDSGPNSFLKCQNIWFYFIYLIKYLEENK